MIEFVLSFNEPPSGLCSNYHHLWAGCNALNLHWRERGVLALAVRSNIRDAERRKFSVEINENPTVTDGDEQ